MDLISFKSESIMENVGCRLSMTADIINNNKILINRYPEQQHISVTFYFDYDND